MDVTELIKIIKDSVDEDFELNSSSPLIGENSIIGASSLVNKHIPPNTVHAGVPAKFLKNR